MPRAKRVSTRIFEIGPGSGFEGIYLSLEQFSHHRGTGLTLSPAVYTTPARNNPPQAGLQKLGSTDHHCKGSLITIVDAVIQATRCYV